MNLTDTHALVQGINVVFLCTVTKSALCTVSHDKVMFGEMLQSIIARQFQNHNRVMPK